MSLSATLFGRDSAIFKATNILGLGIPGWLDKKFGPAETEGPRLSDLSVQTSTYGAPIARIYGTVGGMGNLIWLENNKLKETVRKKKSGGKGGGGASEPTKTYSYSATFHIALCEGPIAGIRRIWCGDKLIYNAGSDDLETIIASNQAASGWKLYLGTDDQMPDPRYEAEFGAGNVSANRGLAYIAFYDFQLADYSNSLQGAQFKIEVMGAVSYSTQLLSTVDQPVQVFTSNVSFPARCTFTSAGKSFFAVPKSESPVSSFVGHRASASEITSGQSTPSLGTGVPPNYDTDVYGQVLGDKSYVFSGGGDFSGPDGHIQRRGDSFVGISNFGGRKVYFRPDINLPEQYSVSEAAGQAVCISGDSVFVFSPSYVRQYDVVGGSVVLTIEYAISIVIDTGGYCRAKYIDGFFYIYGGQASSRIYRWSPGDEPEQIGVIPVSISPSYYELNFHVDNYTVSIYFFKRSTSTLSIVYVNLMSIDNVNAQLSDIIDYEASLSSLLSSGDVDTSGISSLVRGYRAPGGSSRSALEPLQAAFPFDVRAHGYKIQFLPRGQASVATIPWEDLGATSGDSPGEIFQNSREMDPQLPAKTVVKYLDAAREYAIGEQFSARLNTEAVNKVERDLAIVLNADEASGIAEMLNFLPWLERTPASFTLPPPYRYLEPGDVVTVTAPEATYEIRLKEVNEAQDGRLDCQSVPNRAALYTPAATGSEGVPPSGTIGLAGDSLLVPLDIPVIDETLQNAPGFVGVMTGYSDGWPGGLAVRTIDGGQTWADLQAYAGKATIGTARGTLPASSCTLIDQRTLTVDLISGELESVTRDQMLAGINYAAYGVDGRWEIVRFQNAALQAGGEYIVSGFVRGEKGTEWATGLHQPGDYFILLDDPDNAFIGMAVGSIAVPATYRGVTSGASVDDATDVPFTYQGVNLECLSPVYAKGTRDGSSNFTGTFTRRSRLSSSWWATGVVAPVGEASESYEIDVMSGSAVKRTITATSPSFTYSAANQTTDFGSAQASITFRIYQLSAVVGRGLPLEVTL